jgi:hypothetical protein
MEIGWVFTSVVQQKLWGSNEDQSVYYECTIQNTRHSDSRMVMIVWESPRPLRVSSASESFKNEDGSRKNIIILSFVAVLKFPCE